jgi:serine/threonine-protein kinase
MVLVAEGRFLFGRDRQPVSLPAYYIDRTEVTNRAYGLFCQEKGHALPEGFSGAGPDLPVVNVTIYDAREFAAWAGKRLPGAKEWEKAARGSDGRSYPWGERNDPKLANVREESGPVPPLLPAAALPGGASPCGAVQMAGNVWEFVDEQIQPSEEAVWSFASLLKPPPGDDEQWFTMRGGSHRIPLVADVAVEWAAVPGRFKAPDIGFRCIRELR